MEKYIEPNNEEIMGWLIQAINDAPLPVPASPKKKKLKKKKRYTRLFQSGKKARTYQKEKFSWSQYNNYKLAMQ